ncbi:sigma-70 family RNA polymerase sigma factor [Neobacillus drentensis]|uniref:sigma-70 family RNA polymerase sigma factor n=1 Tax=Neobacillus drentensis TaxID=220684 RepID=UPI002FFE8B59
MSQKLSEDQLVRAEQENSFENDFWSENYPKLRNYCHFLTRNSWDGDDIAQETYMKALKYSQHQQKMTTALLNKIAYHHWVDLVRRRKKEVLESNLEIADQVPTYPFKKTQDSVEFLLNNFTPNQAIIFLLKEGFQYQLKEIAAILNSTEMAVKANLHRAKKRLEKANDASSVEWCWNEEEREQLSSQFYEALNNHDPSLLIDAISKRAVMSVVPMGVSGKLGKLSTNPKYSPSSTLCMAA